MKLIKKRHLIIMIFFLSLICSPIMTNTAKAADLPENVHDDGTDLIMNSYMATTEDGLMRLVRAGSNFIVEYYDNSFTLQGKKSIGLELPVWGGFYKGTDAYYIVEGQNNENCIDNTEVVRIIKYDMNWNRLGSGSIYAKDGWDYEVRYPFDHSCVNMTEVDGNLYVITGREGYVDPKYGQGHQGMMLIRMNEASYNTEVIYGDFYHSFSQYIDSKDKNLYFLEQSEGGRCTSLSNLDLTLIESGKYSASHVLNSFSVFDYGGKRTSAWSIPCYATADDIAISSDNVLGVGTSIDQTRYDEVANSYKSLPYNIYLTVTPLNNFSKESSKVIWLTSYTGEEDRVFLPRLTKVSENRFFLCWNEGEEYGTKTDANDPHSMYTLHYLFIDGAGKKLTKEFTASAGHPSCHPILNGSNIVYFTNIDSCLDFYSIDGNTGELQKKVYLLGEYLRKSIKKAQIQGLTDQTYTGKKIQPAFTVIFKGKTLNAGTDYSVYYGNNKDIGVASVTVYGKGKYKGKTSNTFNILPKPVKIKKIKCPGKGKIKVTYTKSPKTGGYQITVAKDKKFKKVKKSKTSKKTNVIIKGLKKGTYYVKVRAYKTVKGKKIFSINSKTKKVKVK